MSSQLEVRAMNGSSIRVASGRQFKGTLALRTRRALALALVVGAHAAAPSTAAAQPSAAETKQPQIAIPSIAPDLKQQLERLGVKLDLSLTGFAQGQATGSDDSATINALTNRATGTGTYGSGRLDALLELDSTRLGLWRGGHLNAHLEVEGGGLPGWRGGAFWPVNTAAILPLTNPGQWSLSSLYVSQSWGGTRVMVGKVNVIDLQAQNPFFGGWGIDRFANLALVLPPTGVTPATLMAASISQQIGEVTLTAMAYDPNDRTQNSVDRLFADGVNLSLSAQWNGRLWKRSSTLGIAYILSTTQSVSLEESYVPSELQQRGLISPSNLTLNFGHQVWPSSVRPGKGIGVYGRVGVTGGDPNPIQSSLAMGISGEAMWRSRPFDGFGLGVYLYNWTGGLATTLQTPLQQEVGLEMYYNLGLTRWLTLSPNLQVIQPATAGAPLLTVLGIRSRVRF
jgi:porin